MSATTASTPAPPAPPPPPPPSAPKPEPPFVLDHESVVKRSWDAAQFLLACFIGVVVPLRIGFGLEEWRPWVGPDVVVDVAILADIIVHCITSFEEGGETVRDRSEIFWRYFYEWFWVDVVSIVPLEIISAAVGYTPLFRCNRLLRLSRLNGYFGVWERDSSLKPSIIRLSKLAFGFIFFCHFLGCAFYLIVSIEGPDAEGTWIADYSGTASSLTNADTLATKYFRSWYWATVVTAGFNNSNPTTIVELVFTLFVTTSGVMLFGTIIGMVGDLATNLDGSKLYFRSKLDDINDYMRYKKLPDDLQEDIRQYYEYLWKTGKALESNELLRELPQYIKTKMILHLNREIVTKVPLFKQCADDEKFIAALVLCLKSIVTLPNFYIVRKGEIGADMYFISRGELNVVSDDGKVVFTLRDGGFFGEIALLYDTKRTATIVSRTYCDMFNLTKDDFKRVLRQFPEQSKGIKEIAKERFQKIVEDEKKREAALAAERARLADEVAKEAAEERQQVHDEQPQQQGEAEGVPGRAAAAAAAGADETTTVHDMIRTPSASVFVTEPSASVKEGDAPPAQVALGDVSHEAAPLPAFDPLSSGDPREAEPQHPNVVVDTERPASQARSHRSDRVE